MRKNGKKTSSFLKDWFNDKDYIKIDIIQVKPNYSAYFFILNSLFLLSILFNNHKFE